MIIFKREWKTNLKSLLIWSASVTAVILLLLLIYPQMAEQQQDISELLKAYPEGLQQVFGMDQLDMSTLLGFYGIEVFMMLTLLGSIYASIFASNILSKEENDHTAEFLLAKPVTRRQIVTEKLLAVLCNVVILNIVATVSSLIGFQFASSKMPMDTFWIFVVGALLLHLTFAAISFFLSSFIRKSRKILSVSLAIVILSYFLSIAVGLSDSLEALKFFTPFEYVKATEIATTNQLDPLYLLLMGLIMVVSISLAYFIYHKKDMAV
ncbi:ABC-2 type transport system permease protein [Salirhabdus euzebyi]|uniref:ABC-2 type transport system permease protein n=1 Tax=Salirhabdus euzebyi TaxID=394506 RepID=A0A841Q6N1_9BACI|nr:ABC transporter permease subunit [Salirhabdus euzebyi]MBB6454061.1 ABC-2 type transport system permease protein [Salirhabdus euzebyi]